ncbi:putative peroxisomal-coenzyme A synthetase [Rosellinia necatrix]|uniref:Putative peroxisomal-coenzyme A synthetase n=1 Tax=Rosellinia necatrix TaxID=77044 RepID=A0A1S8A7B9_ROSNE|nr:putative peroxisomal-coenzyme A synthetase [Rosellinia necatrix]
MARPGGPQTQPLPCLLNYLKLSSDPALRYPSSKSPISYRNLHNFVGRFSIPTINRTPHRKPIVAIILPNGPLLAATIVAVSNTYIAAPINPAAGPDQVRADLELSGACAVITRPSDADSLRLQQNGLDLFFVDEDRDLGIRLQERARALTPTLQHPTPNGPRDIAMVLFTSGTSGNRKVVPITVGTILHGVQIVINSWGLTSQDICLNMMPLYHVGGIIRNLFAPLFSGGSTICCSNFDPNLFWDQVEDVQPTWYYASPTMHSLILQVGTDRVDALQKSRIRLICNAAGSLLPGLAQQIRNTFRCTVLPSYGMTEYAADNAVDAFSPGRICLRGSPLFHGYLRADGSLDKSAFNAEGWFDTGDIGYLDHDGYLYITGRNKEVINRGGELISPFEVENAIITAAGRQDSPTFGRISQALAFSVRHETLQEVVGVVLVTPPGRPRVDLRCLHASLRSSLQSVKWPVLIAYMDDLPKRNNKVLRVRLGERMGIPCLDDDDNNNNNNNSSSNTTATYAARHYLALCPAPETELSVAIPAHRCRVTPFQAYQQAEEFVPPGLEIYVEAHPRTGILTAYLAPRTASDAAPEPATAARLRDELAARVHGYLVPHAITAVPQPLPRDHQGHVDGAALAAAFFSSSSSSSSTPLTEDKQQQKKSTTTTTTATTTAQELTRIFADILQLRPTADDVPADADFFALGGDSLRAGRLASAIRAALRVRVPIDVVFTRGTVRGLAAYVDGELGTTTTTTTITTTTNSSTTATETTTGAQEPPRTPLLLPKDEAEGEMGTRSSTRPALLLLQLVPMLVAYPVRRALAWAVFMYALAYAQGGGGLGTSGSVAGRLLNVVLSVAAARLASRLALPWLGIAAKWALVGRLRPGRHPMWGPYHTRWWLAHRLVAVAGPGAFAWSDASAVWYCRLLGAKVGKGVKLNRAQLGEWDLLDIGDNVVSFCLLPPFSPSLPLPPPPFFFLSRV